MHTREAREASACNWPSWLSEASRRRIVEAGVPEPWAHQVEFAERLFRGRHSIICTPTGSGKTLGYLMPIIAAGVDGEVGTTVDSARARLTRARHTALYISPTKALAHDQARAAASWARGTGAWIPRW